jgi:hypothetical protein
MSDSQALDTINNWQQWFFENRVVAELDEPGGSKNNKEKLHDTANAVVSLNEAVTAQAFEKAKECFANTMSEFWNELTGPQLYKAFYGAAMEQLQYQEKELKKAQAIVDILHYKR